MSVFTSHQWNGGHKYKGHAPSVGEGDDEASNEHGQTHDGHSNLVCQAIKDQLGIGTQTRVEGLGLFSDVVPGDVLTEDGVEVFLADALGLVLGRDGPEAHLTVGGKEGDGSHDGEFDHEDTDIFGGGDGVGEVFCQGRNHVAHEQGHQGLADTIDNSAKSAGAIVVVFCFVEGRACDWTSVSGSIAMCIFSKSTRETIRSTPSSYLDKSVCDVSKNNAGTIPWPKYMSTLPSAIDASVQAPFRCRLEQTKKQKCKGKIRTTEPMREHKNCAALFEDFVLWLCIFVDG